MAEVILSVIFAGVTGLMNAASAYQQYRTNHPRRKRTGEVSNYTTVHNGLSMRSSDRLRLLDAPSGTNVDGHRPDRSASSAGESSQQQRALRAPNYQRYVHSVSEPSRSHIQNHYSFSGTVLLTTQQKAPNTYRDDHYGLSTGAMPSESPRSAKANADAHWESFQTRNYGRDGHAGPRAVAVVDYTHSKITMFVESHKTYYRSYKVHSCHVAAFADKYRSNQVFSGVIKGGQLTHGNGEVKIVEDDGDCRFRSSNCWTQLGIRAAAGVVRQLAGDPMFLEMVRGAVFGLICCVHQQPSCMNVDMRYGNGVDFVHVDTDEKSLQSGPDCQFSVFSFCNDAWAREKVLVG